MAKYKSKGTLLKVGDGEDPEVFTTIAQVGDTEGPGGDVEDIDMTDHESPGNTVESIPGLVDEGDVTVDLIFDPGSTSHQQLIEDRQAGIKRNYQILFTDTGGTTATFNAYVKNVRPAMPVRGGLKATTSIKVAGEVDWEFPA